MDNDLFSYINVETIVDDKEEDISEIVNDPTSSRIDGLTFL